MTAVEPARHTGGCTGTGCLKFAYDSDHRITVVRDPRSNGSDNQKTTIAYDGSNRPSVISDASIDEAMLQVNSYAATSTTYRRVEWQDGAALEAAKGLFIDLTPDGSTLNEYVPLGLNATPSAADLAASYGFDGVGHYSLETRWQSHSPNRATVSRRGTNAALAVDNLADPLTAGETLWSQSPDQYFASVAAGNPDLYRTTYTYNALHETVDTITPYTSPSPAYSSLVGATPNLAGYWRLGDTTGSTATDSSGANHNGSIGSGITLGQAGALVNDFQ